MYIETKMSWVDSLKEFAKETGKFSLPKKDTEDYSRVKAIQERLAKASEAPPVAKPKKEKKVKVANVPVAVEAPVVAAVEAPVKVKKVRVPKVPNPIALPDPPVAAVASEPIKVPRKRKTLAKVANPAPPPSPEAPVRRGPKLVDRGVRLENKEITMSFD